MLNGQRHRRLPFLASIIVAAFVLCWQGSALAQAVGFSSLRMEGDVKVDVWYPTHATPAEHDVGLFTQTVAPDAPVDGRGHGLILVSHGNGGTAEAHYDTALALAGAGFVVASVMHPGDNYQDQSRATHLEDRPRTMHALIDFMLTDWTGHATIDPTRIGIFGFSAGGFTALVTVGGQPDLSAIGPYCTGHATTYVCTLLRDHPAEQPAKPVVWQADPRIKAAVVAAPAVGFVFSRAGLAGVHVPIQLWRAADDHILPAPDYVEPVLNGLPLRPEYHVVPGADHFDFLGPCSDALAHAAPEICLEHDGFERTAFHVAFNRDVVAFFRKTLGRKGQAS
jgi:predicted dienelactone hydrolase